MMEIHAPTVSKLWRDFRGFSSKKTWRHGILDYRCTVQQLNVQ